MRRSTVFRALIFGALAALILPSTALADFIREDGTLAPGIPGSVAVDTLWVIVAGALVMFMQAGFAFLEIGFSRGKNAGTVVAKILTNFSIAGLCYWAVGFAFAFGAGSVVGHHGFFLQGFGDPLTAFPVMGLSDATVESKWFFQFVFCAVSLAIVWGTTLERIKFGVYIIYAVVFASVIYPIASHWVFGGGFLQTGDWLGTGIVGMQDFAGSTAVHLIGATGALTALLLLGPRKGKYDAAGKPRAIPGHNMPLFGLGVLILWLGWFGFNPGSALNASDGRFPEILLVTQLAACAGVLTAIATAYWRTKAIDIGMAGNGAIAALVAITAPSGYISCGFFTSPRFAKYNAFGDPNGGLFYSGSLKQLIAQCVGFTVAFTFVFAMSFATFWAIKKLYGLRVTEEEEEAGLDISEHGMYGYPEQFIPIPELVGYGAAPHVATPAPAAAAPITTTQEVTA